MAELGRVITYSESMVSRWESGERHPDHTTRRRIEAALGMPSGSLEAFVDQEDQGARHQESISVVSMLPWADLATAIRASAGTAPVRIWQTWLPSLQPLLGALEDVAPLSNEPLRILVLAPGSAASSMRASALGVGKDYPRTLEMLTRAELRSVGLDVGQCIRHYGGLPSIQLYMCASLAFVSWFYPAAYSTQSPQLRVAMHNPLFVSLLREFDTAWNLASG